MFNTPILDIVIGLIFIFLLYSLLVTSINEAIATSLGLRARMLKKGIIEGMLSDTPNTNIWVGFYSRCWQKTKAIFFRFFTKSGEETSNNSLGAKFYRHPIIRNYGASEFYPSPTYIPRDNFSVVLIDVLKHDFDTKMEEILKINSQYTSSEDLIKLDSYTKIELLLNYYKVHYAELKGKIKSSKKEDSIIIDKDILRILLMHLENSEKNIGNFTEHLEKWFDDTMFRVSGWYKRQAQYILFSLGLLIAIIFNVDTIEIASKLSKDKDLREQVVNATIAYSKNHTSPSLIKKDSLSKDTVTFDEAEEKWKEVQTMLNTDTKDLQNIIAIGWGDYGKKENEVLLRALYADEYTSQYKQLVKKNPLLILKDPIGSEKLILANIYNQHWFCKIQYVLSQTMHIKKLFGFILTAFAISLGAPFWFDMLNKLINIRGSEKKETSLKPANEKPTNTTSN